MKQKKWRHLLAAVLTAALLLGLAGCGGGNSNSGGTRQKDTVDPIRS